MKFKIQTAIRLALPIALTVMLVFIGIIHMGVQPLQPLKSSDSGNTPRYIGLGNETIIVEAIYPDVPSNLFILKTIPHNVSFDEAKDIASRIFNVSDKTYTIKNGWAFASPDEMQIVWIYDAGVIKYVDRIKSDLNTLPEELPTELECKAIADEFLNKLRAEQLTSTTMNINYGGLGNSSKIIANPGNGTYRQFLNYIVVYFSYTYNNLTLNEKFSVSVGKGGEIVRIKGTWWEVEPYLNVQILSPEKAIEKLQTVGYGRTLPRDLITEVHITSIDLTYHLEPLYETGSTFIVPYYSFGGHVLGTDGTTADFIQHVSAVESG